MSNHEEELSKKDRIVNAWLAVGPEAKASNIAEITDSSVAYASRIQTEMEASEITEEEVEEIRDEQLLDEYANRLERIKQGEEADGERSEAAAEPDTDGGETGESSEQQQSAAQEAQQQHQERQAQTQQEPSQQSSPSPQQQAQPLQQPPQPHQYPPQPPQQYQQTRQAAQQEEYQQQEFPEEGQQSVSMEQLQELDELLAVYEEEAQFEVQNLPPEQSVEAVGKLFIAQKTRSLLRDMIGNGQGAENQ